MTNALVQLDYEDIESLSPTAEQEKEFWRLIRGRRSIRRYKRRPIPKARLEQILTAASWAPSAHNRQPWRFCVITNAAVKMQLSRRMGDRWRQDLTADGMAADLVERRVAISHERVTTAGALVVVSVSMEDMDIYPDPQRAEAEWLMAVQSTALACQNLLLATHHYGLGACWMCAPLFVPELVQEVLSLPGKWHPQALITLGYPAESKVKERMPLESRILWRE
jgi:coenzyme F420-0:L-glutamate ligase / coenzyme F420-1:gamma-L-glutamate ligase